MQLDIFLDSRDTVLVNQVIEALVAHSSHRARSTIDDLRREYPDHLALPSFETLATHLRRVAAGDGFGSLADEWTHIEHELVCAAAALGERAADFLRPCWRRIARANQAFDATAPHLHPAALYLRAGDWSAAQAAAESVPGGRQSAQVQEWLAVAQYRRAGLDGALPHLLQVAWLAPERLAGLIEEVADPLLARVWRGFLAALSEMNADWFPAWYLVEHPEMSFDAYLPDSPAANAFGLTRRILALEKEGHSPALVAKRARLKETGEVFFAWYMARRRVSRP